MNITSDSGWAGHPRGLSTLFFTEMWERFSYYGMRALLIYFLVAPEDAGGLGFDTKKAGLIYGTYTMSVYMLAVLGGFVGDNFLGLRRAVLWSGFVIAAGHFTLALHSRPAFFAGLVLVALGSGLLKANMSALVGTLYPAGDPRRDAGFSIFYMGVNLGALAGPFVTGYLAQSGQWKQVLMQWGFDPAHSWHWGFASAGVGMLLALGYFLATQRRIAHVGQPPPAGELRPWGKLALVIAGAAALFCYVAKSDEPGWEWMRALFVVGPLAAIVWFGFRRGGGAKPLAAVFVFCFASMIFWAVFEQGGSTIALFCDQLTRHEIFGWSFPSAWFQAVGSIFVVVLAPGFAWLWIKLGDRQPSSPVKFVIGLALLGLSFALMIPAARLTLEGKVSPLWVIGLFFLQSVGELCLSPVGLSTMTKLAPAKLVGLVMGVWFLATALGSKLAGVMAGLFTANRPEELAAAFGQQSLVVGVCTVVLLALVPWLKRLMGDVT